MSGDVLFLVHRVPWPPDRGDKIRSHHLLHHIARTTPVHVATFAEGDTDMDHAADLASIAHSFKMVRRTKSVAWAAVEAVFSMRPIALTLFADKQLQRYVHETIDKHRVETIYVFSVQMAQYIPANFKGRIVMDFCDVDSAKFASYAQTDRGLMKRGYQREAFYLGRYERKIANRADVSIFISAAERQLFLDLNAGKLRPDVDIQVIGNGIDTDHFDPAAVDSEPSVEASGGPSLLFTGQMDYAPNVAAVRRFTNQIMPLILKDRPDAQFFIAGRRPTEAVTALDGMNGTRVVGGVDDMRCWLKAATVVVAPLDIARGVQNKVLEAMAMAKPVVLSPGAATGIDAADGKHFIVADSDEAFAAQVLELLNSARKARSLGIAARRQMQDVQSWHAQLMPVAGILYITPYRAGGLLGAVTSSQTSKRHPTSEAA